MDSMKLVEAAGSGVGSEALAAAAGGFFGSWFGNGWGGNGFGPGRGYGEAPVVAAAAGANLLSDISTLDKLNTIGSQIDGLGLAVVQGQGQAQLTASQGFNGINAAIYQTSAQGNQIASQGFAGLNTAIVGQGFETRLATKDLMAAMAECCCNTQKAILAEGAATRQLIQNNLITELQTQLCDSKAKTAQLENTVVLQASQAAQTQQIISTVIAHLDQGKK